MATWQAALLHFERQVLRCRTPTLRDWSDVLGRLWSISCAGPTQRTSWLSEELCTELHASVHAAAVACELFVAVSRTTGQPVYEAMVGTSSDEPSADDDTTGRKRGASYGGVPLPQPLLDEPVTPHGSVLLGSRATQDLGRCLRLLWALDLQRAEASHSSSRSAPNLTSRAVAQEKAGCPAAVGGPIAATPMSRPAYGEWVQHAVKEGAFFFPCTTGRGPQPGAAQQSPEHLQLSLIDVHAGMLSALCRHVDRAYGLRTAKEALSALVGVPRVTGEGTSSHLGCSNSAHTYLLAIVLVHLKLLHNLCAALGPVEAQPAAVASSSAVTPLPHARPHPQYAASLLKGQRLLVRCGRQDVLLRLPHYLRADPPTQPSAVESLCAALYLNAEQDGGALAVLLDGMGEAVASAMRDPELDLLPNVISVAERIFHPSSVREAPGWRSGMRSRSPPSPDATARTSNVSGLATPRRRIGRLFAVASEPSAAEVEEVNRHLSGIGMGY